MVSIISVLTLLATQFTNCGEGSISTKGPLGNLLMGDKNPNYALRDEIMTFTGFDLFAGNHWTIPKGTLLLIGGKVAKFILNETVDGVFDGVSKWVSW